MSKLSAFLHPVTTSEEKEVVISNRFQDESGQPVPFKIRALTQEENDAITRQATRRRKEGGQTIEQLDSVDFTRRMVVAATVEPDFSSKELSIANDIYQQFSDGYIGVVNNNEQGRMMFKSAIVGYLLDIQANNGIQNFEAEDVTVEPGEAIDAIVVNLAIQPVDSVEKIYVTITVN